MPHWLLFCFLADFGLGVLLKVALIGKYREPLTPVDAVGALLSFALWTTLLLVYAY